MFFQVFKIINRRCSDYGERFFKKNTKQFLVKKSSRTIKAYQYKIICIIFSKASVAIGILLQKKIIFLTFFVLFPDNEFLAKMICFLLVKICGKKKVSSVVLSKKFASSSRRKLQCKLRVSNYQCTGKTVQENRSRYVPSVIMIYHCYYHITLLLFFTNQISQDCDFSSATKCCIHSSDSICSLKKSILLQKSCHSVI